MDLGVNGKVFLLAGASKGLGYAIAENLAQAGATLLLGSRDVQRTQASAAQLAERYGTRVVGAALDMADAESIRAWVARGVEEFGEVNGVLVNAGGPPPGGFDAFTDDDWQSAFNLTLMSAVRLVRETLPHLRSAGGGAILMLTSSSVKEPIDFLLLSNVMRSGVSSLAKSLSRSLAGDQIRVNNLIPGIIYTDRIKSLDANQAQMREVAVEQQRAANEALIPLGRYGEPEEFGRAGAFLLSDAASYITGSSLVVDGGTMKSLF